MSVHQARKLRRTMSHPEVILWRALRLRPDGNKFRRQHPLTPFVLDFYCASAHLAIEVDGFAHDCGSEPARDARRDQWLLEQGIETMRIAATDVEHSIEAVMTAIVERCRQRTPPPADAGPPPRESAGRMF